MIFSSAKNYDGDTYMSLFTEAMRNASPQDMRAEVQDVCEYFETFWVANERAWDRLNNGTYTITQVVARLVGRLAEAEAKLKEQQDAAERIRAELVCCRIYERVNDTRELTFEQALKSGDWHDLCYWGEAAARLASGQRDLKETPCAE